MSFVLVNMMNLNSKVSDGYGIPTGIMGFSDVQVTDDAIYAVFSWNLF